MQNQTSDTGVAVRDQHVVDADCPRHGDAEPRSSIGRLAASIRNEELDLSSCCAADGSVTVGFTDIEASTELMLQLGDRAWVELLREHNEILRREVGNYRGTVVKSRGDGFMVAFAAPEDAVLAAIEIQRSLAAWNLLRETPIRVRIGLHTGRPVYEAADFFGRDVNLAARIADHAAGGEVLVSERLRELLEPREMFNFDAGAPVALKGFDGEHATHVATRATSDR